MQFLNVIPNNSNKAGHLSPRGSGQELRTFHRVFLDRGSMGGYQRRLRTTILRVITVASVTVWALVIVPVHNTL